MQAELTHQPSLELAHALARDPELVAELLQRERLVLRDEAEIEDLEVLALERLAERLELALQLRVELGLCEENVSVQPSVYSAVDVTSLP